MVKVEREQVTKRTSIARFVFKGILLEWLVKWISLSAKEHGGCQMTWSSFVLFLLKPLLLSRTKNAKNAVFSFINLSKLTQLPNHLTCITSPCFVDSRSLSGSTCGTPLRPIVRSCGPSSTKAARN